jgi:Leucine-rich repeat (LRR) protein
MNRITSVNPLCRSQFCGLEVLDLGGNKVEEIPVALIHYLSSLCQLTLTNNEI